jgi:hypothetical protein
MVPVPVIALHPPAVPEAPRLGGLRRCDTDEEGDRRESAQNELHRVVPPEVGICKTTGGGALFRSARKIALPLEPAPEAARLGWLNKGHTGDRHCYQHSKNKPHDINLPGCNSPKNTAGGIKISYDPKV